MVSVWFIYGLYMVYIWFIYGLYMVSVWFIYGLYMVYFVLKMFNFIHSCYKIKKLK